MNTFLFIVTLLVGAGMTHPALRSGHAPATTESRYRLLGWALIAAHLGMVVTVASLAVHDGPLRAAAFGLLTGLVTTGATPVLHDVLRPALRILGLDQARP